MCVRDIVTDIVSVRIIPNSPLLIFLPPPPLRAVLCYEKFSGAKYMAVILLYIC